MKMKIRKNKNWFLRLFSRGYSFEEMVWAFDQGIHEGRLRQNYGKSNDFIQSQLEFYIKNK